MYAKSICIDRWSRFLSGDLKLHGLGQLFALLLYGIGTGSNELYVRNKL